MLPTLPPDARTALDLIPRSVALDYKVFPIGGHFPTGNRFEEMCGHVRLLCLLQLSRAQRQALRFLIPRCSFTFIDPEHPEYQQYHQIVAHFQELVAYHYQSDGPQILGTD